MPVSEFTSKRSFGHDPGHDPADVEKFSGNSTSESILDDASVIVQQEVLSNQAGLQKRGRVGTTSASSSEMSSSSKMLSSSKMSTGPEKDNALSGARFNFENYYSRTLSSQDYMKMGSISMVFFIALLTGACIGLKLVCSKFFILVMLLFLVCIVLTPEYVDWFVYGVSSYLNSIYCWMKKLSSLKFLQSWNLGMNNNSFISNPHYDSGTKYRETYDDERENFKTFK